MVGRVAPRRRERGGAPGVDLVVTTTQGRAVGTSDWLDHLVERGSDGVVLIVSRLLPAARDELARLQMPVVLVDPVGTGDQGLATVAATDWAGARDATEHLLALGHRRIAMVTGPIDEGCHQDRLDGYRTAPIVPACPTTNASSGWATRWSVAGGPTASTC